MHHGSMNYTTKTGRKIVIDYFFDFIDPKKAPVDKERFSEACKKGCDNYDMKWSCPPCSPSFAKTKHKKYMLILMLRINGRYFSDCAEWMKAKTIHSILKSKLERMIRGIAEKYNGYCYSSGPCKLCKVCSKKYDKPCKHPDKMKYALESTGVDCNKLVETVFKTRLFWYKKGGKYECGSVVGGIEFDNKIDASDIVDEIKG